MDGRTVWVQPGDVEGRIEAGNVVTATRELSAWCLRGDDGSAPVPAGTALEIVEDRAWGASMALEQAWSTVGSRSERRRYRLPAEATAFIAQFDDSRHVEPFEFEVDEDDYTEVLYEEAPA